MKQIMRSITFILFVGGWALASAAVYVVRTPSKFVVITKDHLGYRDTYVDTRKWTLPDDGNHPALVARLIQLGRTDALAHTVDTRTGSVDSQLAMAVQNSAPASPDLTTKAKAELNHVLDEAKAKLN
jgi:hypothetical protein